MDKIAAYELVLADHPLWTREKEASQIPPESGPKEKKNSASTYGPLAAAALLLPAGGVGADKLFQTTHKFKPLKNLV